MANKNKLAQFKVNKAVVEDKKKITELIRSEPAKVSASGKKN